MIQIRYIKDVFKGNVEAQAHLQFSFNMTLKDYLDLSNIDYKDKNIIVSSGKKNLDEYLTDGDIVTLTDKVKDAIGFIWWVGTLIVNYIWAHPWYALMFAYSIYSAVSTNARKPNFGSSGSGMDENSPTYGWDGIRTTQSAGIPIPIVYGEHKVGGQIINQYVRTDGDKNYLNVLLALCEGEVEGIDSLEINGNPAENFSNITQVKRYGTNNQTMIPNFHDLHNATSLNVELAKDTPYVYTTTKDDVEAFELTMSASNGLFSSSQTGGLSSMEIAYTVEYKLHADPSYTSLGSFTINGKSQSPLKRIVRKDGLTAGKYDIRITKTSQDSTLDPQVVCDLYLTLVDEITTEDLAYPNIALLGIEALAEEQLNGATPNFTCIVKGRKVSVPRVMYGGSEVDWEDYYWDASTEEYKLFSDDSVCTWDGTTYVNKWSANPIWCLRDLLTNTRYGLGDYISSSSMDADSLLEMSRYCEEKVDDGEGVDEKRFRLDVVLDSKANPLDLLSQLCATFRAFFFYSNGTVILKIDKPETPVQLFGMGNIIKSSFLQSWKTIKERNQAVEVQFLDKDKGYEQEIVSVYDDGAITAGEPIRTKTVKVFCTRISQAIREGKYALLVSKYINRTITLKAGIDAIGCQAGDVINVAHDVPQWGFSGRVQSGSTAILIKLDRAVTIVNGTTYKVSIQFADDTIEERTVTSGAGTYTQVAVSSFSQTPAYQDKYSFGIENILVKPFRVVGLKRAGESDIEINAIEYNEDVYDTDSITIPENNYTEIETDISNVLNLNVTEGVFIQPDGTVRNTIDVWFQKPDDLTKSLDYRYNQAKIWLSDDGGSSWAFVGTTAGTSFSFTGDVIQGTTYTVKVQSVTLSNLEGDFDDSPYDTIEIEGLQSVPANVSSFSYAWGDILLLSWADNTEADLAGYEVRDEDDNWGEDDEHLIYKGLANRKTLNPTSRTVGSFYIRAYNTSGNYSIASATITPENDVPSTPTGLGADVMFNVARAYWTDTADVDLIYYEVYKSETNAWAGEETLLGRVSGRSIELNSKTPRSDMADSATDNTIVSSGLIGLGDDYFNGDTIIITEGTGEGQTRTISDFTDATGTIQVSLDWDTNPDSTSKFMITDNCFIKVRAVDQYGEGVFTSALEINFNNITENMLGDNVVTARKIYVSCLSAISANVGCLTAGIIQGVTYQTASGGARTIVNECGLQSYDASCCKLIDITNGTFCLATALTGARTIFNANGIYGYNSSGCQNLQICNGEIIAVSAKFVDPACDCNYSYLSSGRLRFHDILGDVPYVTRICSGATATGGTVCLCGWTSPPQVIVGIRNLQSFNSSAPSSCQSWALYNDNPVCWCNSPTDYGYCFVVHACLVTSASVGATCTRDINFDVCYLTGASTCSVYIRHRFQIWCNSACANYYAGCLCYNVCYRVNGSGTWCCCAFTYLQPHANTTELKSTQDVYVTVNLPCGACWQFMSSCVGLSWVNTGITSGTSVICCYLCTRTASAFSANISHCRTTAGNNICISSNSSTFSGSNPTGVYYTCLTFTMSGVAGTYGTGGYAYACGSGSTAQAFSTVCTTQGQLCDDRTGQSSGGSAETDTYNSSGSFVLANSAISYICLDNRISVCIGTSGCAKATSASCLSSITLYQCWCATCCTGSAGCCNYQNVYTTQDTYSTQCVLDPAGCLNWLAISY